MKKIVVVAAALIVAGSGGAQELRSAGTLLVDLSAEALAASDGDAVAQWPNAGTLGGAFSALAGGAGATFTNSLLGRKAVLFGGSAQSVLTNGVAPAALTGANPWSLEAWVWVASLPAAKAVYFAWTENADSTTWPCSRVMFRYDTGGVAVDNLGGTVGFGVATPAAGAWHHIAVTRNEFKQERIFVDGNATAFSWCSDGAQSGIPLAVGGVKVFNAAQYTNYFAGAVSRVRVHTGILSEQDVLNNFLADAPRYNAAGSASWTGGAGNWNDAAGWSNAVVGASGKAVSLLAGAVAVTNNVAPSLLSSLDIVNAAVTLADSNARLDSKAPLAVGRSAGSAGALDLSRGSMTVSAGAGPAALGLGACGAVSTLTVGGPAAAALYASQVRTFAGGGAAAVQVKTNGVVELDAFAAEASASAPAVLVAGGTLRSKAGLAASGYAFNVPQIKLSTGGAVFDWVAGSTQSVSSALAHDAAGAERDGGLRKTSPGVLTLSGANSYNGETSVEAGTLRLATRLTDGLVYRLDASSNALATLQLADGSNVVTWSDANGSGFVFNTNKSERCPVYDASLFGGRGGVRFSRDSTIYRLAANRPARVQTVVAVISPAANNSLGGLWGQSEQDTGIRLQNPFVQFCGNGNDFASSGWVYTNGAAGNAYTIGQPLVVTAISGAQQTWVTAIGDYWGHTAHRRVYKGDIAEILVYERRLDDAERQAVESYLRAKWLGVGAAPQLTASPLPTNTVLSVRHGAGVELGGVSVQLASLNGAGAVGNRSPVASTLAVGGLDADSVYAGAITGNVAVTKLGAGSVTLAGPNSFTGPVSIEAGVLRLASNISSITGLVYRLDASLTNTFTRLADGTNVSAWADAAGSGFAFAVTDNAQCPVYDGTLFSGHGGLRFGLGSRRRMVGSGVTNAQTVFAVNMLRDTSNDIGGLWGRNGEDKGLRLGGTSWYYPGNGDDFHNAAAGGIVYLNGVISNSTATVGQPHLVTSVCGGSAQTFTPAIGDYWNSSTWSGRYFRGEVAEILVYNRRLTDIERQTVEASLMTKWFPAASGTVLPQSAAVTVAAGAKLDLLGNAVTIGSLAGGGLVTNGQLSVTGAVAPDGTLTIDGAPALTGTLAVDVSGSGASDRLAVSGALNLSGLALVPTLPAGTPAAPVCTIITATGGVTGTFESAALTGPWKVSYGPTTVRLIYFTGTLISIR
jgi:autotransporter-associated beta strand protein